MPVMDGLEAAKKLLEVGNKTPVIAITANIMFKDQETYRAHGMADCLDKPFKARDLWACLLKYLTPVEFAEIVNDSPPTVAEVIIDRGLGVEQTANDEKLYDRLLIKFAQDGKNTFSKLTDALDSGDVTLARRIAHSLKSSASMFGATRLAAAALFIENSLADEQNETAKMQMRLLDAELIAVLDELAPLLAANGKVCCQSGILEPSR